MKRDDPLSRIRPSQQVSEWAKAAKAQIRKPKVIDRAAEAARRVENVELPSEERA